MKAEAPNPDEIEDLTSPPVEEIAVRSLRRSNIVIKAPDRVRMVVRPQPPTVAEGQTGQQPAEAEGEVDDDEGKKE